MNTKQRLVAATTAFVLLTSAIQANSAEGARVPARLECSALTPKRANDSPFVSQMTVNFSKGQFSAERRRIVGDGMEQFTGSIDPLGRIEMTGTYDDKQSWIYRLKGRLEEKGPTILKGDVEITTGAVGRRSCTMTFLQKPEELLAAFAR